MVGVTTLAALIDLLLHGSGGLFTGAKLILGSNLLTPARSSVFADVTEATFTGYVQKAITWGSASYNPATGLTEVVGTATYQWFGPADNTGQVLLSWGLNQAGPPDVLLACGNFGAGVSLTVPTDTLALAIKLDSSGTVTVNQVN